MLENLKFHVPCSCCTSRACIVCVCVSFGPRAKPVQNPIAVVVSLARLGRIMVFSRRSLLLVLSLGGAFAQMSCSNMLGNDASEEARCRCRVQETCKMCEINNTWSDTSSSCASECDNSHCRDPMRLAEVFGRGVETPRRGSATIETPRRRIETPPRTKNHKEIYITSQMDLYSTSQKDLGIYITSQTDLYSTSQKDLYIITSQSALYSTSQKDLGIYITSQSALYGTSQTNTILL